MVARDVADLASPSARTDRDPNGHRARHREGRQRRDASRGRTYGKTERTVPFQDAQLAFLTARTPSRGRGDNDDEAARYLQGAAGEI